LAGYGFVRDLLLRNSLLSVAPVSILVDQILDAPAAQEKPASGKDHLTDEALFRERLVASLQPAVHG
jgi:hypothetical protein